MFIWCREVTRQDSVRRQGYDLGLSPPPHLKSEPSGPAGLSVGMEAARHPGQVRPGQCPVGSQDRSPESPPMDNV